VRTLLLFGLLAWLLRDPLLAGLILVAIFGGSYLLYSRRLFRWRQQWRDLATARHLARTLTINPEDAKAHSDLGGLLVRRGRFAEALPHLEKAIERCEDLPDTNFSLGWALLEQGNLEKGRRYIETALAIDPRFGYGEPHLRLGNYFFERKQFTEAIPHYQAARDIHRSGLEAAAKLGESTLAVGEPEKAVAVLREALAVYRTLPWFRKQEERGWALKARAILRRATRAASSPRASTKTPE
jgi:tetratricopeptide (TPR) repeat protein